MYLLPACQRRDGPQTGTTWRNFAKVLGGAGRCDVRVGLRCQSTCRRQYSMRGLSRAQGETNMLEQGIRNTEFGADKFGFRDLHALNWNLLEPELYECAINGGEGKVTARGGRFPQNRVAPGPRPQDQTYRVDDH